MALAGMEKADECTGSAGVCWGQRQNNVRHDRSPGSCRGCGDNPDPKQRRQPPLKPTKR